MLAPYLKRKVHTLSNNLLLMDSLNRAVPRNVYDAVLEIMDYKSMESLFQVLTYRHQLRHRLPQSQSVETDSASYRRLLAENINDHIEEQMLKMYELVSKIHRNKRNYQMVNVKKPKIALSNVILLRHCQKFVRSIKLVNSFGLPDGITPKTNQETWQHMFGPLSNNHLIEVISESEAVSEGKEATEVNEINYSFECPPYNRDVRHLIFHKKNTFSLMTSPSETLSKPFKPKGYLVSHLHEHKSSVNQMTRYGGIDSTHFLTCSDDGTIRLWDLSGFENRHVINRSKYLFKMEFSNGLPINFKGLVCCGVYLITYTNEGIVYVFEASNQSSLSLVCSFKAGSSRSSIPLLITSLTALSRNIFAVALTDSVCG